MVLRRRCSSMKRRSVDPQSRWRYPRPYETFRRVADTTKLDRVFADNKGDGDRRGCRLSRKYGRGTSGRDHGDPSLHQLMIEVGDEQGLSVLGSLARSDIESKALEGVQGAPRRQLMEYENSERLSEDFYGGLGRLQLDLLRSVSRAACHGKPGPLQVRCRARTHAIHCLSRG
jgi:hypothetical protein